MEAHGGLRQTLNWKHGFARVITVLIPLMADTEKFSPALLQVERISNLEGWRRLEHEWNALLQDSAADAVFLCWEWMDTWLEVYGDGGEWIILTVRDPNGWLLGVAPMMLDKGSGIVGRWQRRLLLLGQKADTASEYLDWILRRGYESAAVESFAAFILSEKFVPWDILEFTSMRSDAASIPLLIAAFKKRGVVITQNQTVTSPYMILPETWEAFWPVSVPSSGRDGTSFTVSIK